MLLDLGDDPPVFRVVPVLPLQLEAQADVDADGVHWSCRNNGYRCFNTPGPFGLGKKMACSVEFLGVSAAMYTRMGIHSCEWFLARDIVIVILWAVSFIGVTQFVANPDSRFVGG